MGFQVLYLGNCFILKCRNVMLSAWWIWLVKNQPVGDKFLCGREAVDSHPSWGMKQRSRKTRRFNKSEADVIGPRSYVCLNSSTLHFVSLKFDNIKGPYYSVLAKEVAVFRFSINKQFVVSGSCVVDLETGSRDSVSGCLSYCRDTILIGVKWSTEAVT
jgi:hypothetical protein